MCRACWLTEAGWGLEVMRYELNVHFANIFKKWQTLIDNNSVPQISLVELNIPKGGVKEKPLSLVLSL